MRSSRELQGGDWSQDHYLAVCSLSATLCLECQWLTLSWVSFWFSQRLPQAAQGKGLGECSLPISGGSLQEPEASGAEP